MPDDTEQAAATAVVGTQEQTDESPAAETDTMGDDIRAQQAVPAQETQGEAPDVTPEGEKGDEAPSEAQAAQEMLLDDRSEASGPEADEKPPQVRERASLEAQSPKGVTTGSRPAGPVTVLVSVALVLILAVAVMLLIVSRQQASQKAFLSEFQRSMSTVAAKLSNAQSQTGPALVGGDPTSDALDDYSRLTQVGNTLFRSGQFEEAAESYRAALKLDPTGRFSDEARYHLGRCLLNADKPDEAVKEFRAVVTHTPGSRYYARSAVEMSELLIQKKNFVQARRLLYMVLGSRGRLDADEREALERTYYAIARCFEGEAETIEAMHAGSATGLSAFLMNTAEAGKRVESASDTPTSPTEWGAQLGSKTGDAE